VGIHPKGEAQEGSLCYPFLKLKGKDKVGKQALKIKLYDPTPVKKGASSVKKQKPTPTFLSLALHSNKKMGSFYQKIEARPMFSLSYVTPLY
jgi:hypothetical protein